MFREKSKFYIFVPENTEKKLVLKILRKVVQLKNKQNFKGRKSGKKKKKMCPNSTFSRGSSTLLYVTL